MYKAITVKKFNDGNALTDDKFSFCDSQRVQFHERKEKHKF